MFAQLQVPEESFVEQILRRLPAAPPNHHRIVELNEAGVWPGEDPAELEAGALGDRIGRKQLLVAGWLVGLPVPYSCSATSLYPG